ncbi:copper resistance protein B [Sulfurimonas sp. HSL1-2]|uniref:copper resistance protein B n=1 Tax=Thiomicrolovo zhangzhouensis TaxID=3131933 RepID=UPI0031F73119
MRAVPYAAALLLAASLFAEMNDDPLRATLLADRLETASGKWSRWERLVWDVSAYAGYDLDKAYLYSEGSEEPGESESQNELLYSRALAPFWDIQIGAEADTADGKSVGWGVVALQGVVPYYFETRLRLMVNDQAVALNAEAEYEMLLRQRLVLTPRIELQAYSSDVEELGAGAGLSSIETGLRLRYEFIREFAPYIGVAYAGTIGNTRKYTPRDEVMAVVGIRFWF